ncbi:MAG TPA: hypothetical protein VN627_12290 [Novosphingobium sp.]|nr:hypothetical protein [Novosphingobium sp.]
MENETTTPERSKDSIETHIRCKCSKCGHEGDVWIDPTPLFVAKINEMVLDGLSIANERIEAARRALKRALDFQGVNDRTLAIKTEVRAALDVIGWSDTPSPAPDAGQTTKGTL